MVNKSRDHTLRTCLSISFALNGFMAVAGMVSSLSPSLSILGKISDFIAAPVGFLIGRFIQPKGHTALPFIFAALEGLIFSAVFYAAIAWVVLKLVAHLRARQNIGNPPK